MLEKVTKNQYELLNDPVRIEADSVVAHRGHQSCFPENSLLSILDALAAGAKHIEFDVQFTQDAMPVLYHDDNMRRISDVDQSITSVLFSDLKEYRCNETGRFGKKFVNNPLTLLTDILPWVYQNPEVKFYLELKLDSIQKFGCDRCLQAFIKHLGAMPQNLIYTSYDADSVDKAKVRGFKETALVLQNWGDKDYLLTKTKADFAFIDQEKIPKDGPLTSIVPLIVYEVGDIDKARAYLSRGAAAIETFHIRRFLANQ
jgi:glycerophosphoryl diester phosphodiesterase